MYLKVTNFPTLVQRYSISTYKYHFRSKSTDTVSLPETDTVVTTKEMINLKVAAVPDFSVYDMDTF